ncbi:MAG: hypothetical protein HY268_16975 [Deltaproteobacteria bacterium]|nr:hypothetical protein [Deltaproteobacteria bacterium]
MNARVVFLLAILSTGSPSLRRVRHQNQLRRGDKLPYMAQSMDDASGRDAWEFSWRLLGTDILYQTVRFPVTRPLVTVADGDTLHDVPTASLRLMGEEYPPAAPCGGELRLLVTFPGRLLLTESGPLTVR